MCNCLPLARSHVLIGKTAGKQMLIGPSFMKRHDWSNWGKRHLFAFFIDTVCDKKKSFSVRLVSFIIFMLKKIKNKAF